MRRVHAKNVAFVKTLFTKPVWYNQTLVHKNWPMIKKAIKNMPDPLAFNPRPTLPESRQSIGETMLMRRIYQPQVIRANFIGLVVS